MDSTHIPPRDDGDPGAVADGDAQLDQEPPNVTEAEPPPSPDDDTSGAMQRELASVTDRYLRMAAEFDNYRRRVEREKAEAWGRAQGDLAGRLLDSLDDLERFSLHAEASTPDAFVQGVRLVERKLRSALEAAGLETVKAEGEIFDPNTMEAVAMVPTDSQADDDVVSDVFQPGYRFKGTLLRPARVRVKKHGA
jgi:molecular chaperone GrpE